MLTIGIDSGSTITKGVLWDGEKIVEKALCPTSADPLRSAQGIYHALKRL